jgi:hypothetical protein
MAKFEEDLDEQTGVTPKKKSPADMQKSPLDLLNDAVDETAEKRQDDLNDTWGVVNGEPHHGHDNTNNRTPGSNASEGRGDHKWGINDNGSK